MKITQFEQSGFVVETEAGFKLAVDIAAYTPMDRIEGLSVDAMIVSHIHGDHFSIPHIQALSPKKVYLSEECIEALGDTKLASEIVEVKVGDTIKIDDNVTVHFFDVDHGPNASLRPRENFGLLLEVDDQKIYFAGDMFYPSGIDVATLEVDYALIPIGGFYTFGPKEAADFSKSFKKIMTLVPMHYHKTPEAFEEFKRLVL